MTAVDLTADIASVAKQRGTGPNTPEQILIDSYVSIMESMDVAIELLYIHLEHDSEN